MKHKFDLIQKKCSYIKERLDNEKSEGLKLELEDDIYDALSAAAKEHDVSPEDLLRLILKEKMISLQNSTEEFSFVIDIVDFSENAEYWLDLVSEDKDKYLAKPILIVDLADLSRKAVLIPFVDGFGNEED